MNNIGGNLIKPVIKWTGSKRLQAERIVSYFPTSIKTYYEPFCGGASVLYKVLEERIDVKYYICSDKNKELIALWNIIKNKPNEVYQHYLYLWNQLNVDADIDRKKEYYTRIRERFNLEKNPMDFLFIMRTAFNGVPRYNKEGKFNTSFHITRNGIHPLNFKPIIYDWSQLLNKYNVQFVCCDYRQIQPSSDDFCYFDPPYSGSQGLYYGTIDYSAFWNYLRNLSCDYMFSFDGQSGDNYYCCEVPSETFTSQYLISNGKSAMRKLKHDHNKSVHEKIYIHRKEAVALSM